MASGKLFCPSAPAFLQKVSVMQSEIIYPSIHLKQGICKHLAFVGANWDTADDSEGNTAEALSSEVLCFLSLTPVMETPCSAPIPRLGRTLFSCDGKASAVLPGKLSVSWPLID